MKTAILTLALILTSSQAFAGAGGVDLKCKDASGKITIEVDNDAVGDYAEVKGFGKTKGDKKIDATYDKVGSAEINILTSTGDLSVSAMVYSKSKGYLQILGANGQKANCDECESGQKTIYSDVSFINSSIDYDGTSTVHLTCELSVW
jgi:hypothetical protein